MRVNLISSLKTGGLTGLSKSSSVNEVVVHLQANHSIARPSKDVLLLKYGNLELTFVNEMLHSTMIDFTNEKVFCELEEFDLPKQVSVESLLQLLRRNDIAFTRDNKVIPSEDAFRMVFQRGASIVIHKGLATRAYFELGDTD